VQPPGPGQVTLHVPSHVTKHAPEPVQAARPPLPTRRSQRPELGHDVWQLVPHVAVQCPDPVQLSEHWSPHASVQSAPPRHVQSVPVHGHSSGGEPAGRVHVGPLGGGGVPHAATVATRRIRKTPTNRSIPRT
jgi:hypothetical protein